MMQCDARWHDWPPGFLGFPTRLTTVDTRRHVEPLTSPSSRLGRLPIPALPDPTAELRSRICSTWLYYRRPNAPCESPVVPSRFRKSRLRTRLFLAIGASRAAAFHGALFCIGATGSRPDVLIIIHSLELEPMRRMLSDEDHPSA